MTDLAPCPACKRHVRIDIASCPFCATALPALRARNIVPRALTRAAIFSAALAGCQTKKAPNPTAGSATGSATAHVADDAPSPIADAGEAPTATGSADGGIPDAGAPAIDAGMGSASPAQKKDKATRFEPKNPDAKRLQQQHQLEEEQRQLERQMAKPYGAPPARRRVV